MRAYISLSLCVFVCVFVCVCVCASVFVCVCVCLHSLYTECIEIILTYLIDKSFVCFDGFIQSLFED